MDPLVVLKFYGVKVHLVLSETELNKRRVQGSHERPHVVLLTSFEPLHDAKSLLKSHPVSGHQSYITPGSFMFFH